MTAKKKSKLLRKIIIFLLILIAINEVAKQYFYRSVVADDVLFAQDEAFEAAPDTIDYLIMGHSRPHFGVDATEIPRAFNYASLGENSIYSYYKLKHILENSDKKIGTIVLPAGLGSFSSMSDAYTFKSFYWGQYVDYIELGNLKDDFSSHAGIWFEHNIFPYAQSVGNSIDEKYGEAVEDPSSKTFSEMDLHEKVQNAKFMLNKNKKRKLINSEVALHYLQLTLDLCKEYNKPIYFIKYPITDIYKNELAAFAEAGSVDISATDSIITNADGPFFLFEFDEDNLRDYNLFEDAHHLNAAGKQNLTLMVKWRLTGGLD